MQLEEFAKKFLEKAGATKEQDSLYKGLIGESVMELTRMLKNQGHSGMSAAVTVHLFTQLNEAYQNPDHPIWQEYWRSDEGRKHMQSVIGEGDL